MRRSLPILLLVLLAVIAVLWVLGQQQPHSATQQQRPAEIRREPGSLSQPKSGSAESFEVPSKPLPGHSAELQKAFTFKARLVDSDGKPIANAHCELWLLDEWRIYRPSKPGSATSDTAGILELRLNTSPDTNEAIWERSPFPVPDGWLSLTDSDLYKDAINDYFAEGKPAEITFTRGQSIRGRVLDEKNQPVAGAKIGVMPIEPLPNGEMLDPYCSTPSQAAQNLDELDARWIDDAIGLDTEEGMHVSCVRTIELSTDNFAADEYKRRAKGVTDAEGNFELRLLPKGQYFVQARHELGLARTTAEAGGAPVVIVLQPQEAFTLEIDLQWCGEIPESGAKVDLWLGAPYEWMTREGFQFHWDGTVDMAQRRSCTLKLLNVPMGDWRLCASNGREWKTETTLLLRKPGAKVTLFVGPDNEGTLKVRAKFAGEPTEDFAFEYRRTGALSWEHGYGDDRTVTLPAGAYEVRCGSPNALRVDIKPGEITEPSVIIPSKLVRVRLADEWKSIFGESSPARISIQYADREDAVRIGGDAWVLRNCPVISKGPKDERGYVSISPGAEVEFLVAPGIYTWLLHLPTERTDELDGVVDLRSNDEETITLSPDHLPDLALVEVTIDGYLTNELPEVTAEQRGQDESIPEEKSGARFAVNARTNWGLGMNGPVILRSGERWLVWGHRGQIDITAQAGETKRTYRVGVPGKLRLGRDVLEGRSVLRVFDPNPKTRYWVEISGTSGYRQTGECSSERNFIVPSGNLVITVTRDTKSGAKHESCRLEANVPSSGLSLDLSELEFIAFGEVTVRCVGARECWWDQYRGIGPLIQSTVGSAFALELCAPDEFHFMPRSEKIYRDRSLPPGKYTITPWPDAPKSACKTFEIKPGEKLEIVLEG